jgi:hypothetical protein
MTFRQAVQTLRPGTVLATDNPNQVAYLRRLAAQEHRAIRATKQDSGGWVVTATGRKRQRRH